MAALLLQELEASEISKLPKQIQNKIEKIISDLQYEVDSLKAQQEQFRVDSGECLGCTLLEVFVFLPSCRFLSVKKVRKISFKLQTLNNSSITVCNF